MVWDRSPQNKLRDRLLPQNSEFPFFSPLFFFAICPPLFVFRLSARGCHYSTATIVSLVKRGKKKGEKRKEKNEKEKKWGGDKKRGKKKRGGQIALKKKERGKKRGK